jgi:hypothetical protein
MMAILVLYAGIKSNKKRYFQIIRSFFKMMVRPAPKDLKLEERHLKLLQIAEEDRRYDIIRDLQATYENPPKVCLGLCIGL